MAKMSLSPWTPRSQPSPKSVDVTVVILAKDEERNISTAVRSAGFAKKILVIDSGSSDKTVSIARDLCATVIESPWRGFGPMREAALRRPEVETDYIYVLDADEWVSSELAQEIHTVLASPQHNAYWQYFRLVFQGQWIRHCGWYPSARSIRLMHRDYSAYPADGFSEHPIVTGQVGRLQNDVVDEDRKGLARWLHKHVDYAVLEGTRRGTPTTRVRLPHESRLRHWLKDQVAPRLPARPLATFVWMYILRAGFLDGRQGFRFCFYHAWFQYTVSSLQAESSALASLETNSSGVEQVGND